MAGACASAMATRAHTITRTNSAMAPRNFRRRTGMAVAVAGAGAALYGPRAAHKLVARVMMAAKVSDGRHQRAIRFWLYAVAAMVLAMVLVGGATRLTESGLSITEWQPVMGVIPPLTDAQWQAEFAKYQAIPQYQALNHGMTLAAFKAIFWWEWTHRLLGRIIGVVFLLPLLWFLWRGWIGPVLRSR